MISIIIIILVLQWPGKSREEDQILAMRIPTSLAFFFVLLLWLPLTTSASNPSSEPFLRCLLRHSQPPLPISEAIYTPANSSYSAVLQSYIRNLRFNQSSTPRPLLIVTPFHESHVQISVICAKKHSLLMKIRSGGHDYEGISYVSESPFFLLDMFNLRAINVDVETETAWVEAGATLGELYYRIGEKSKIHGFPAGVCPTVGVGGHFGGGGYGNLMRKYGLSVDNIIDARLVDASGRVLDRESMGEDLFWAIRGGGIGSFGVALAFKVNIVRLPERLVVFRVEKTLEQNATNAVYQWQHVADNIDRDLFIRLTLDTVNNPETGRLTVRASFIGLFLGDSHRLISVTDKSFPKLGLRLSDCIEMSWLKSILFWTYYSAGNNPDEILLSRKPQILNYLKRKSDYVTEPIPWSGLESIWKKMIKLEKAIMTFNPYGGRMGEISETATPFPHRAGNLWKIQYASNWEEGEKTEAYIRMMRKMHKHMTPFVSKNPRSAFLCYRDLDLGINRHGKERSEEGREYGMKYFKDNYERLVEIKTKVDPSNFFRNEQSLPTLLPNPWSDD